MSKKEFIKDIKRCRVIAVPKRIKEGKNGEKKITYDIYKTQ